MLSKLMLSCLLLLCLHEVCASTSVTAPSPSINDCTSVLLDMADCLSFVQAGSNTTKPTGACCAGLKRVVKTSPDCLCSAFQLAPTLGVDLNLTKALTLPSACRVNTPALTKCKIGVAGGPGGVPAPSPSGAPSSASSGVPSSLPPATTSSASTLVAPYFVLLTCVALAILSYNLA